MNKHVALGLKILAFIVAVIITAELLLRAQQLALTPEQRYHDQYALDIATRIHTLWLAGEGDDIFAPPFLVFSNNDFTNPERLQDVYTKTRLPTSTDFVSSDFLQDPDRAASTTYSIHTNALGFRGTEVTKEKPPGTYRVVVLGSYQAFGHGVDDDETYPAQLEAKLNAMQSDVTYEVWNGGRHSGTAIVGLAQMQHGLYDFDPDLIILDYGFVDALVFGDDFFPTAMHYPDSPLYKMVRGVLQVVIPLLDQSLLWVKLWAPDNLVGFDNRTTQFKEIMLTMLETAHERDIPVVLVRQLPALPHAMFKSIMASSTADVSLIDVAKVFKENPPVFPPASEWKTGAYGETWMAELDPELVSTNSFWFRYYPYNLDLYQVNKEGQRVVADALVEIILKKSSGIY